MVLLLGRAPLKDTSNSLKNMNLFDSVILLVEIYSMAIVKNVLKYLVTRISMIVFITAKKMETSGIMT